MMVRRLATVLAVGAVFLVFHGAARAADVLLESDFGECPVQSDSRAAGRFKGVLPTGWGDSFVGWNKSQAESHVVTEKGKRFLRFTISNVGEAGNPQFATGLPKLADGSYYRLTVRARNNSTGRLSIGIRMTGKPYRYRYERQIGASPEWVEKSWLFKLNNGTGENLALFLLTCGVGTMDVATVRLEQLTAPAEVAEAIPRPAPSTKNFFRNSRLPLGLQAGWNLDRMSSKATATPDLECIGPSGSPALRLESNQQTDSFTGAKGMRLFSEPFQVGDVTVPTYVGLSFKGSGTWHINIISRPAGKKIEPTSQWKRASLEFTPDFAHKSYTLAIAGSGTLWVDAFCAWSGDENRPYVSAGACEVALGLPPSEIAETRIQFDKVPAAVTYRVTGDWQGGTLKAKAVNVYGKEKLLPAIRLDPATVAGTIDFGVFPETPYGQFRVESWVERDGNRISPMNEMVVTRLKRPVFWGKDAPRSPFGCHFLSVDRTIKTMKAGGVNWARLHDAGFEYIGWWWLEPEKGKWEFRDDDIRRYRANNIKIFAQLGTAPKWASYLSKVDTGRSYPSYHDHYFQPLSLADFANYVTTVVARYKGVIDEYFVWNEPFYTSWWGVDYDKAKRKYITSKNPQADFAALTKAAYAAAKAVDPTVKVSGFNTAVWEIGQKWTKGVYDAGGITSCDIIDYHFYTTTAQGFRGSHTDSAYDCAVGYIRKKEGRLAKPVYMSEGQCRPGTPDGQRASELAVNSGLYKHTLPYNCDEDSILKADLICKYVLNVLANKVEKVFLYSGHCYRHLGAAESSDFCVLLGGDGYAHPSLAAHSNLALHIEGRKFLKAIEVANGVYAYLFAGRGRSVAVISGRPGCAAYQLPNAEGLEVSDLFGNPLPAKAAYKGTLVFAEAAMAPKAMEKLFAGK